MTILEAIKANQQYKVFGIRTMDADHEYQAGEVVPNSYDWDIEADCSTYETTGETLPGACAVEINLCDYWLDGSDDEEAQQVIDKALEMAEGYPGNTVFLIAGCGDYEYGNDPQEIIIESAEMVMKIR